MLAFTIAALCILACIGMVLLVVIKGRLTTMDGTPIESPFKGYSAWAQVGLWLIVIALSPLLLFLVLGTMIYERYTKPCDMKRPSRKKP